MSERTERHAVLERLVAEYDVESQQEMLDALSVAGLDVHQSTLSRDLRELGIRKRGGRYVAIESTERRTAVPDADGAGAAMPVVRAYTPCGPNLITVHTGTGQAQLLGVMLDALEDSPITGTIAGDDTVLVVTKSRAEQRAALALLDDWFGGES
ncbi:MAG TPA: hypothetical protein VJ925_06485 [Longimicrobiales bacterium]|nr:hypothetical protein [Longimicrobiales bacterium]